VTADEILDLVHSVDPSYRQGPAVAFQFADATLKFLRKLKDGEGRYLWQAGMGSGSPDTLWGYRYVINQSMPALSTGNKAIVFGDHSKYIIRDVLDVQILRLDELFAQNHQVAFLAFSRHDGNLVDAGTRPIKFITQA
jgi:HK97 family phage major capsid protein